MTPEEQYRLVQETLSRHSEWQIRVEERIKFLAPQDWVHQIISPIKDSVSQIEHAMVSMKTSFETMSNTQNEILREKAQRDREESQQRIRQQEEKFLAEMAAIQEKNSADKKAADEKYAAELAAANSKSVWAFMDGSGKVVAWASGIITILITLFGGLMWLILHSLK